MTTIWLVKRVLSAMATFKAADAQELLAPGARITAITRKPFDESGPTEPSARLPPESASSTCNSTRSSSTSAKAATLGKRLCSKAATRLSTPAPTSMRPAKERFEYCTVRRTAGHATPMLDNRWMIWPDHLFTKYRWPHTGSTHSRQSRVHTLFASSSPSCHNNAGNSKASSESASVIAPSSSWRSKSSPSQATPPAAVGDPAGVPKALFGDVLFPSALGL
mmetsp:Transcript_108493/g.303862  ORF Transcript_108493/g.303862 Transcript_108493/m.303862 type:complete len:221 (-) Transcript_108493:248-910(-)